MKQNHVQRSKTYGVLALPRIFVRHSHELRTKCHQKTTNYATIVKFLMKSNTSNESSIFYIKFIPKEIELQTRILACSCLNL